MIAQRIAALVCRPGDIALVIGLKCIRIARAGARSCGERYSAIPRWGCENCASRRKAKRGFGASSFGTDQVLRSTDAGFTSITDKEQVPTKVLEANDSLTDKFSCPVCGKSDQTPTTTCQRESCGAITHIACKRTCGECEFILL